MTKYRARDGQVDVCPFGLATLAGAFKLPRRKNGGIGGTVATAMATGSLAHETYFQRALFSHAPEPEVSQHERQTNFYMSVKGPLDNLTNIRPITVTELANCLPLGVLTVRIQGSIAEASKQPFAEVKVFDERVRQQARR